MIPKIIHYCWFGGSDLPPIAVKCIESWKKYCPDYEIKLWNEKNIDISTNAFMKNAYDSKKWGFVPDVARLKIVYDNGGIYLDTDVEIIQSLDSLLDLDAFMGIEPYIDKNYIALGLGFGATPQNKVIEKLLTDYTDLDFPSEHSQLGTVAAPKIQTKTMCMLGWDGKNENSKVLDVSIFASEYFCPKLYYKYETNITKKTYSIHHYSSSWLSKQQKLNLYIRKYIRKLIGDLNYKRLKNMLRR